jgi:hypothetical protein
MDILTKIWGIIRTVWEYLDGNKTDLGLKIGGWVLAITGFTNAINFHPGFLQPILDLCQQIAIYLTGGGLAHKIGKVGMKIVKKEVPSTDPTVAPPAP